MLILTKSMKIHEESSSLLFLTFAGIDWKKTEGREQKNLLILGKDVHV